MKTLGCFLLGLTLTGCPRPEGPSQSPKASPTTDLGAGRSAPLGAAAPIPASLPAAPLPPTFAPTDMAPAAAPMVAPAGGAEEPPKTVKLRLGSSPKAQVRWGKKVLGITPLSVERLRDSGPLDLVFVAHGYFPVHTRAFTFKNDSVHVQMTKVADRQKLYGAKKELPPACDPATGPCQPGLAPGPAATPASSPAPGVDPVPAPKP